MADSDVAPVTHDDFQVSVHPVAKKSAPLLQGEEVFDPVYNANRIIIIIIIIIIIEHKTTTRMNYKTIAIIKKLFIVNRSLITFK